MLPALSRRTFLSRAGLAGCGTLALPAAGLLADCSPAHAAGSLRAVYHLTPSSGWICDPQRPIYLDGRLHLYYLRSDTNAGDGWWEHAISTDGVAFTDAGVAIPLDPDPIWTGSSVIDSGDTAGFGAGTVVALVTEPTGGDVHAQQQFLYYSRDGGTSFTGLGAPVIANPDHSDWFRDPKLHWDSAHTRWVAAIGRKQSAVFYTSPDLRHWTYRSTFAYTDPNIGGFECTDLYEIEADDGSWHWVLGASVQGDYTGRPDTHAYWVGYFDGETYHPDHAEPQWLDYGWDFYSAVTWASADAPRTTRYAIGWMNNWHYAARTVPTDSTDGFNGQHSVVRELRLLRQPDGRYTLVSRPTPALADHVTRTISLPDVTVDQTHVLDYAGDAYRLELDLSWESATNLGISVGRSEDGSRHTNIGIFGDTVYVDRRPSDRSDCSFGVYGQSNAPIDQAARSVHLDLLVDRQSVEVFVNAGYTVLSNQVYFRPEDTAISFYTDGGSGRFGNITISEFGRS